MQDDYHYDKNDLDNSPVLAPLVFDLERRLKESATRLDLLQPVLEEMQSGLLESTDNESSFDAESINYIIKLHGYTFAKSLCQDLLNKHRNGIHSELWETVVKGEHV